jgi:hypothetical protein
MTGSSTQGIKTVAEGQHIGLAAKPADGNILGLLRDR